MAVGVVLGQVGAVQTVNGQIPDISGNIVIDANSVGAIPKEPQAVTASYLASNSVTKDKIQAGAVTTYFNVTLPTSAGWIKDELGWYVDLAVSGMLVTDRPIIDIMLADKASDVAQGLMEEYAKLYSVSAFENRLRLRAKDKTTKEIKLQVMCVRK